VAIPIAFGPPSRKVVGFFHPARLPAYPLGVVLCNPLGYEAMSVHRTYRHLAERLAASGFAALRFDYDGTGDSAGLPTDPDRVEAWIGSITAAMAEVRTRGGVTDVALFGVRFGATLAMQAASREGGVPAVVAWAPVVSGRAYVRELRAFRLLRDPKEQKSAPGPLEEVGGYAFARETLDAMSKIDLLASLGNPASPGDAIKAALVLSANERAVEEKKLVQRLESAGANVRLVTSTGYAGMMRDDPYETEVPSSTLETIVDWLRGSREPRAGEPKAEPGPEAQELRASPAGGEPGVRETLLQFGEHGRFFGVLAQPDAAYRRGAPVAIFLNAGANTHVGPHRTNVTHARELAARGYPAFRFDVSGLGESGAAAGAAENKIFTMATVPDVSQAMTAITRACGAERFVVVGLCSGAYLAYHSAAADPRVAGQILLSPFAFEWKEGDPITPTKREIYKSNRFYAHSLLDRSTWKRALHGEINVRGVARTVLTRLWKKLGKELAEAVARLREGRGRDSGVERTFRRLSDRGVESLILINENDGGLDMIAEALGTDGRKMRRRKNFSLVTLGWTDHEFKTIDAQRDITRRIVDYFETRFP
jgi:alpha-beta hydrolase superfamily lysophospholipase